MKKKMLLLLCLGLVACQSIAINLEEGGRTQFESSAITSLSVGAEPHGIAASMDYVYSANIADKTLSVIDARTHALIKTMDFEAGGPSALMASPDQDSILILNAEAGVVQLLKPEQDHEVIKTWKVGRGPDNLQISPDNQYAYVALTGEDYVVRLNLVDLSAGIKTYVIGSGSADGHAYRALTLGLQWLAVSNPGDNNLSLLNLQTEEVTTISAGNDPATLGIGSEKGQDQKLIIGNKASHTVSLYDLNVHTMSTLSGLGLSPTEMVVFNDLKRAYITMSGSNQVAVIDVNKQRLVGLVEVGERPVHIYREPAMLRIQHEEGEGSGERVWIGNDSGKSVSVIDAQTLAVLETYRVGKGHHKMAFAQNQCFVSNLEDDSLTVLKQ